jgi:hypothetical protein
MQHYLESRIQTNNHSDGHSSTAVGNKKPNADERSGTPNLDDEEDLLADDLDDASKKPAKNSSERHESPSTNEKNNATEYERKESAKENDEKVNEEAE